jgi:hypothetical protein
MKTINQNPAQSELGPFPFGDGMKILDIRYDEVFKAVFTKNTEKSRFALSDLISSLIGHTVAVDTINANEPAPAHEKKLISIKKPPQPHNEVKADSSLLRLFAPKQPHPLKERRQAPFF